jgi:DNA-binding CsgD family transcriptional regulator
MSTPGEQSREWGGRRRPPGAHVPKGCPCSNGHALFCEKAWASIADKLGLSPRQMQVARYLLADQSDGEIAQALGLSRGTVHTHVDRLHEKLHVHSRVQLATQVFATYLAWRIESPPPTGCPLRSRLESV